MRIELNEDQARQGETLGVMRYVLGASMALAVVFLAVTGFSF
jgi:hypothetical protein